METGYVRVTGTEDVAYPSPQIQNCGYHLILVMRVTKILLLALPPSRHDWACTEGINGARKIVCGSYQPVCAASAL